MPDLIDITIGSLDDPSLIAPTFHCYAIRPSERYFLEETGKRFEDFLRATEKQ